jgi:hypothetical protein
VTSTTPAEHDPFFQLLTEALRAGPGSAQWGEAVAKLRDGGVEGADEYRLILRAREDIELGRDFRKVQAGPEFTRKVLDSIEREGTRGSGVPTATIVAILSGLVILGVIITVIVIMSRGGPAKDPQQAAIGRLEAASLPVSVASASTGTGLRSVNALPSTSSTQTATMSVGGLVTTETLDPATPAVVEAEFVPSAGGSIQLFVSDSSDGASAREIVWNYRDGRASVIVPGGAGESVGLTPSGESLKASIRFDRENAIIEAGGRRLYAGPHKLGEQPRYAGVRLIHSKTDGKAPQVKSLTVAQAAPPAGGGR